jgi:hypothetical protein
MNKNTIVDFKVGNSKGIFVAIPYSFKNFTIEQYPVSGTYLMEADSKELNHWKTKIPKGNYKYIGRSNELSPEFVEETLNVPFKHYINMLNKLDITINYSDCSNFWAVLLTER